MLVVNEAGLGVLGCEEGRVQAAGAGWAWLRGPRGPVHLTGPAGPRGPLTAVVARVPVLEPGARVRLDQRRALVWRTPSAPEPVPADRIAAACAAVRAHLWNDPRALALGARPLDELAGGLAGRGPGLTPAGDDALLGYLLARRAIVGTAAARADAALVLRAARRASGGPSLALLRADGAALGPALRRLGAYGRTTGPAILAGLVGGLSFRGP
ncbi:MAG: hypothetical protein QOK40_2860 [Miltoncostaeaceae bacterium]|nr:hypothetical protein [Miltoncostaeaceae bacterium]